MAYRNKTYVCFDADEDMDYYNLLKAWNKNEDFDFLIYNAHELNNLREGSKEETIKRKLKERLNNSKLMLVLVGKNTKYLYKYVRWEIEQALKLNIPIVCINITGYSIDFVYDTYYPTILKDKLTLFINFKKEEIEKSIYWNIWYNYFCDYKQKRKYSFNEFINITEM